jgi:adenylate kinase
MAGRRVCTSCSTPFHVKGRPPKKEGVCDVCGGALELRADDKPEVVTARLKVYHEETAPLKEFYRSRELLKEIENQATIAATTAAIMKELGR